MIRKSFALMFASELFAALVGFGVLVVLARRLGPSAFADFEYGSVIAAWWLVVVRGGFDAIVYREAARRPRLVRPLTDLLIGLRGVSALVALIAVMLMAWASGPERGRVVAMAGLVLIPSAMASDVGFRAVCRFGPLALSQSIRALGLALGVGFFVVGKNDVLMASACVVLPEIASTLLLLMVHRSEHGPIRPRFRRRAWAILARRGAIAGATRFARVTLYAADLLILGSLASSANLGPYAAARRVAFALLALGLVVPSAVAPWIAKAWSSGSNQARHSIELVFERMFSFFVPATLGLMLTADRWMPWLFSEGFAEGGPWLALIAARIPFVLASNLEQSALIACRLEGWALRLMLGMVASGLVAIPSLAILQGAWGVAWGVLAVEIGGAFAGWVALSRLSIAPGWTHSMTSAIVGCVALVIVCRVGTGWPLPCVVIAGAGFYAIVSILLVRTRSMNVPDASRRVSTELSGVSTS
jgi:O-antigen/teichoic acid export membrane protein